MTSNDPGQDSYNDSSFGDSELPGYQPQEPAQEQQFVSSETIVQGDGQISPVKALTLGFTLFTRAPAAWIVYMLLSGVALGIAFSINIGVSAFYAASAFKETRPVGTADLESFDIPTAPMGVLLILSIITALVSSAFTVWGYNAALQAAEGRPLSLSKFFALKHSFVPAFLVTLIMSLLGSISQLVKTDIELTLIFLAVFLVAGIVVGPLIMFAPLYALDLGTGVGESFTRSFNDCKGHWMKLCGFILLFMALGLLSAFTMGLAFLVIMPMYAIGMSLLYRQVTGGIHVAYKD